MRLAVSGILLDVKDSEQEQEGQSSLYPPTNSDKCGIVQSTKYFDINCRRQHKWNGENIFRWLPLLNLKARHFSSAFLFFFSVCTCDMRVSSFARLPTCGIKWLYTSTAGNLFCCRWCCRHCRFTVILYGMQWLFIQTKKPYIYATYARRGYESFASLPLLLPTHFYIQN